MGEVKVRVSKGGVSKLYAFGVISVQFGFGMACH